MDRERPIGNGWRLVNRQRPEKWEGKSGVEREAPGGAPEFTGPVVLGLDSGIRRIWV